MSARWPRSAVSLHSDGSQAKPVILLRSWVELFPTRRFMTRDHHSGQFLNKLSFRGKIASLMIFFFFLIYQDYPWSCFEVKIFFFFFETVWISSQVGRLVSFNRVYRIIIVYFPFEVKLEFGQINWYYRAKIYSISGFVVYIGFGLVASLMNNTKRNLRRISKNILSIYLYLVQF